MADRIELTGLKATGYHGVFDHEKRDGQEFSVDITCWLPFPDTDHVEDTVHYGKLAEIAYRTLTGPAYDLIETVAGLIADEAMLAFPLLHAIEVTVHKPHAPIPHDFADVAVVRRRNRKGAFRAILSLGSNIGDSEGILRSAVSRLHPTKVSSVHTTAPWGGVEQPDFLNLALELTWCGTPLSLLRYCQHLEKCAHRTREIHWGPRTLDVDVVQMYGAESTSPELIVPHPHAHERDFVLRPWEEIEPDAELNGTPITELP